MTSISTLVDRASRRYAGRVAAVDGDRMLTFSEVGARSSRLANALVHLDPTLGSRVALILGNRLEVIELDFAIAKAGKAKAPLNPRLSDDERRYILQNCGATIVVTETANYERVTALRANLPELRRVINVDAPEYADLLVGGSTTSPTLDTDPRAPSLILHTSGTTGRPKGATLSGAARIAATAHMLLDEFSAGPDDGMLHVAPMSHGSGSKVLAYYVRGARNITLPKFDPTAFVDAVATKGATSTFVVPTMIRMLLDHAASIGGVLPGLRGMTYGGAPMPSTLAAEALEAFGPILTQVYGSCEAPHPVTVLSRTDHVTGTPSQISSAGHEVYGAEVRVVGADGADVPLGEHGELLIRGANVMNGYWNDPVATEAVLSADGWYHSGDMARQDPDGFLSLVGRERDLVISGGFNVYPAEVESILHRHPSIKEAAVFGTPHELWGEAVTAAVVLRSGATCTEQELVTHCRRHLADYKKPQFIIVVPELPRGATGKIAKKELVERLRYPPPSGTAGVPA
jgi:acyl-CoA synthetase (AMP-forming)/AMP-acid ligase II